MGAELGKPSGPRPEVLQTLETASDGVPVIRLKEVQAPSLGLNCLLCSVSSEREERGEKGAAPAEEVAPKEPKLKGSREARYTGPQGGTAPAVTAENSERRTARQTAEEAVRKEAGRIEQLGRLSSGPSTSTDPVTSTERVRQQRVELEAMQNKRFFAPSPARTDL